MSPRFARLVVRARAAASHAGLQPWAVGMGVDSLTTLTAGKLRASSIGFANMLGLGRGRVHVDMAAWVIDRSVGPTLRSVQRGLLGGGARDRGRTLEQRRLSRTGE